MQPHTHQIVLTVIVCLVAVCVLAGGAAVVLRPRPIRTHQDAVAYVLDQRGIAYRDIVLDDILSHIVGYNSFPNEPRPYTVHVTLSGGSESHGWLDCRAGRTACQLSLPSLGIEKIQIPDPVEDRGLPWLSRVAHYFEVAGLTHLWRR
ncbi:MAG TPA: hypothetical protein VNL77_25040 [Roseiflexaceae bacterium]|nr:hypothetical protein [Roseiflexaceae bacterium]